MVKVKVIGGDNAFSDDNSSFLITLDAPQYYKKEATILFDCGPNAFRFCRDNEIVPDAVFISHTHFDHIGGLEQLAYWSYFIMRQTLNVVAAPEVAEELNEIFKNMNSVYDNGMLIGAEIMNLHVRFKSINIVEDSKIFDNDLYDFKFIEGNHVAKVNYGLLIIDKINEHDLMITGDTKASNIIAQTISRSYGAGHKMTVFHDYSLWDNPFKNIHCCKTDFDFYYDDLKLKPSIKWYLYHNEEFNNTYKGATFELQ